MMEMIATSALVASGSLLTAKASDTTAEEIAVPPRSDEGTSSKVVAFGVVRGGAGKAVSGRTGCGEAGAGRAGEAAAPGSCTLSSPAAGAPEPCPPVKKEERRANIGKVTKERKKKKERK